MRRNPCRAAQVPKERALSPVASDSLGGGKGSFSYFISGRATVLPGKAAPSMYSRITVRRQHKCDYLPCL